VRFLIVHQNFPGQFFHLVRSLTEAGHEVIFLSEPNANQMPEVRKVSYVSPRISEAVVHPHAREFELALRRGEAAATAARQIKALGFIPDIVIGHHGWGELLNLRDVFPSTPLLGYFEFYYNVVGQDVGFDPEFVMPEQNYPGVRSKNAVNLLALDLKNCIGQTPTLWQRNTYPEWARNRIELLPEGVDLETCSPIPRATRIFTMPDGYKLSPRAPLVTFIARNLEPYRGFHIFMRSLPHLLAANPDLHVSIIGTDRTGYGAPPADGTTWRVHMEAELAGRLDLSRVHFLGQVPFETHVELLRRSDAHVYLTYPFVASWSLREAMAIGCAIVASDTAPVHEFITHEETGLLTPFHDPEALATSVLRVLQDRKLTRELRIRARAFAERELDLRDYLRHYGDLIERLTGKTLARSEREKKD
jgi:glycosyltransferase involved in cell wall biosynthesis